MELDGIRLNKKRNEELILILHSLVIVGDVVYKLFPFIGVKSKLCAVRSEVSQVLRFIIYEIISGFTKGGFWSTMLNHVDFRIGQGQVLFEPIDFCRSYSLVVVSRAAFACPRDNADISTAPNKILQEFNLVSGQQEASLTIGASIFCS